MALVALGPGGVLERGGAPVPYIPFIWTLRRQISSVRRGQHLEDQKKVLARRAPRARGNGERPEVRLERRRSHARAATHRSSERYRKALDAFAKLGQLGNVRADGVPAALAARQGRALISSTPDGSRISGARLRPSATRSRAAAGRFRTAYSVRATTRPGHGSPRIALESYPERLALAEAAEWLWSRESRSCSGRSCGTAAAAERCMRNGVPVLVLTRIDARAPHRADDDASIPESDGSEG